MISDKVQMENDLFLEMLEVYINSILYLREVYPSAIFRKRRIYQTAAYISIYPKLNEYLLNTLKQAQLLKAANELYQVDVIIYQRDFELFGTPDDEEVLERYVFRVEESDNNKKDLVAWIQDFEENLRSGLCQLDRISKKLKPLKSDSIGFRIELKTTQSAYHDITQKDNTQTKV